MRELYDANENEEKKKIFDVALNLMEDIGYEKMTIRKICKEADISIGKFYHYFSSKQELLSFFYSEANSRYEAECKQSISGKTIQEQIILFYKWYGTYVESFGVEFVTNFFSNTNPAMNTHIYNNPVIMITNNLFIGAIQNGYKLKYEKTVNDLSCDICVIVKGAIFDWCVRHGEFSLSDYVEDLLRRCVSGIL